MKLNFRALCWMGIGVLVVQTPLLILAAVNSTHSITPDGVAYLRIAKYYRDGQFGLAVNGYWGPLLSWLGIPFIKLSKNPVIAGRIVLVFSALVFSLGSLYALAQLRLNLRQFILASSLVVLFCVPYSASRVGPDLLLSGLLLVGFGATVSASKTTSRRSLLWSGLTYGLAYLAKAVALPIALGLITVLTVIRYYAGVIDYLTARRIIGWTGVGFTALALPWITVLSLHYGRPTFSTSGAIAHAIVAQHTEFDHPSLNTYHVPEAGRITSWEEPSRFPYPYWSPFHNRETLLYQSKLVIWNLERTVRILTGFISDGFAELIASHLGTAVVISVGLVMFFWPGPWRERLKAEPWRLAIPALIVSCTVYLPVFADQSRYYLASFPLLLATVFGISGNLSGNRQSQRYFRSALQFLIFIIVFSNLWPSFKASLTETNQTESYVVAEQLMPLLSEEAVTGISSLGESKNHSFVGLYASFLGNIPWYGNRAEIDNADEVVNTGAQLLIVNRKYTRLEELNKYSCLERIDPQLRQRLGRSGEWPIWVYRVKCH